MSSDRERFFELLPFHVNGTLGATDSAWVQRQIDGHPELHTQLTFMQALRGAVYVSAEASLAGVPADVGYAAVAARIAAERGVARSSVQRAAPASMWQRLSAWLWGAPGRAAPSRLAPLASGLAFGLALGIGVMLALPQLQPHPPLSEVRGTAPGLADGPLLRVTFRPDARESDLRMALIEARALVVAGPTRLGDYYLKTPADHLDAARAALQASGLVQQIDQVSGLPADLTE
jgi:hypothetical protein